MKKLLTFLPMLFVVIGMQAKPIESIPYYIDFENHNTMAPVDKPSSGTNAYVMDTNWVVGNAKYWTVTSSYTYKPYVYPMGTTTINPTTGAMYGKESDYSLRLYSSSSYQPAYAILPMIDESISMDTLMLRFSATSAYISNRQSGALYTYYAKGTYPHSIKVGYLTTNDTAAFAHPLDFATEVTLLQEFKLPEISKSTNLSQLEENGETLWNEYTVALKPAQGKGRYIVFYSDYTTTYNTVYVDNVEICKAEGCFMPTSITLGEVTSNTATISWTADANAFEVELSNAEGVVGTFEVNNAKTYTFDVDANHTSYSARVRVVCDKAAGKYSDWTSAVSFVTLCAEVPVDEFPKESFPKLTGELATNCFSKATSTTTSATYMKPTCWNVGAAYVSGTYSSVPYLYPTTVEQPTDTNYIDGRDGAGDGALYFYCSSSYKVQWACLPAVSGDLQNYQINFWCRPFRAYSDRYGNPEGTTTQQSYAAKRGQVVSNFATDSYVHALQIGVMSDPTDTATFQLIDTYTYPQIDGSGFLVANDEKGTDYWRNVKVKFKYADADKKYITIRAVYDGKSDYMWVDDVTLEAAEEGCDKPMNPTVVAVGSDSASLTWTGEATAYRIEVYQNDSIYLTAYENINDTAYVVKGLSPLCNYTFKIQSVCEEEKSEEYAEVKAKTTCPDNHPFSENRSWDFATKTYVELAANSNKDATSTTSSLSYLKPGCWTTGSSYKTATYSSTPYLYPTGAEGSAPSATADYGRDGGFALYFATSSASYANEWAALPYLDNVSFDTLQLTFWCRPFYNYSENHTTASSRGRCATNYAMSKYGRLIKVGTMTDPTDFSTFELLSTYTYTAIDSAATNLYMNQDPDSTKFWRKVSVPLGPNVNGKYIAFVASYEDGKADYMYVDDIAFEYYEGCFPPTGFAVDNITRTTADLTWTCQATKVNIAYGTSDSTLTELKGITNTGAYTLTGLTPYTDYIVKVQSACDGEEVSGYVSSSFTTKCGTITADEVDYSFLNKDNTVLTYNQWDSATTASTSSSYLAPACWTMGTAYKTASYSAIPYIYPSGAATTTPSTSYVYGRSGIGDFSLYMSCSSTYKLTWAALPEVDANLDTLQLVCYVRPFYNYSESYSTASSRNKVYINYATSTYARTIKVGTMTDPTDTATLQYLGEYEYPLLTGTIYVNNDPDSMNYWRKVTVPLKGATGKYIVLYTEYEGKGTNMYVDDITLEKLDPCQTPKDVEVGSITKSAATVSWVSEGSSFEVVLSDAENEVLRTDTVATTSITYSDLQAVTTYSVKVSMFYEDRKSDATAPVSFTTECAPYAVGAAWNFKDNIYQYGSSSLYKIPYCWQVGNPTTTSQSYAPYVQLSTTAYDYGRTTTDTVPADGYDGALRFYNYYSAQDYHGAYAVLPEIEGNYSDIALHFWGRAAYFYNSWYGNPQGTTAQQGYAKKRNYLYTANEDYCKKLVIGTFNPADSTITPIDSIEYPYSWADTAGIKTTNDSTGNNYWVEYTIPLKKYNGERIVLQYPGNKKTGYFFVDDVELISYKEPTPSTLVEALEGKTIRRAVSDNDYVYVLAIDADKNPTLVKSDFSGNIVTTYATDFCSVTTNGVMKLSDIALTEDGVLVGCNQEFVQYSAADNTTHINIYKWTADGTGSVAFTYGKSFWASACWSNGYTGVTMAFKGTLTDGQILMAGQSASGSWKGYNKQVLMQITNSAVEKATVNEGQKLIIPGLQNINYPTSCQFITLGSEKVPELFEYVNTGVAATKTETKKSSLSSDYKGTQGASVAKNDTAVWMMIPAAGGAKVLSITNGLANAPVIYNLEAQVSITDAFNYAGLVNNATQVILMRGAELELINIPSEPTDLNTILGNEVQTVKFIRNGQLYIQRNGVLYDAQGHVIE